MPSLITSGDSITSDFSSNTVQDASLYTNKLAASLGLPIVNKAISGAQAADQSYALRYFTPSAADTHTILIGANDVRINGVDALSQTIGFIRNMAIKLAAPSIVNGNATTRTGSWSGTAANTNGVNSTQLGAKATTTVSGDAVYISYIIQDHSSAGGTASVKVDGSPVGTINALSQGVGTQNGLTYAPSLARFSGLGAGSHTVEIEVTSSGKIFYLDYIAGSNQPSYPAVYVGNVMRQTFAGQGSDANVATFNTALGSMISELVADGLNITPVDVYSVLDPVTETIDGLHPNAAGHSNIHSAFLSAINGALPPVTYVPSQAYFRSSDGTYWIGEGDDRKQILTV